MINDFISNQDGFEVLTPDGFKSFAGISKTNVQPIVKLRFGNRKYLKCTHEHRLFRVDGSEVRAKDLAVGDWVLTGSNRKTKIKSKEFVDPEVAYDLVNVADGNRYITNNILSHNCDFITDDETLINPLTLVRLSGIQPIQYTGTVRWFCEPQPNKTYLLALDPSLGTGGDYAAIQVFQLPEMIQVAEWQHNGTAPRGQVRILMQTALYLDSVLREHPQQLGVPEIYWTVENNSIGEAILQIIEDTGEERFPGHFISEKRRKGQVRRFRKGMYTTNKNKLSGCARMKSLVESGRATINSANLIKQLKTFVAKETSFSAKPGEHDDLVMAFLLIVRMLDVAVGWSSNVGDLKEYIDDEELIDSEPMPMVF